MTVEKEETIKTIIKEEKLTNAKEIILKEDIINTEIMLILWKKINMTLAMQIHSSRITIFKIIVTLIKTR